MNASDTMAIVTPIVTSLKDNLTAVLPYLIPIGIVLALLAGAVAFVFGRAHGWFGGRR